MRSVLKQKRIPLLVFMPAIMLVAACTSHNLKDQIKPPSLSGYTDGTLDFVHTDGSVKASITIEIADTPKTQMKGLMGRCDLNENRGMLFVFKDLKPRKFWMKNTPVSLDIIFIGGDGCIANIAESTIPMSHQSYMSDGPIKYVVEVRAGFAKHFNIDSNTCIRWKHF